MSNQMGTTIASTCLPGLMMFGYVSLMNKLKATDMLAAVVAVPLKKIKSPYIVACFVIILGGFMKTAITSGTQIAMLSMATLYPVLLASGCSKKTAASAIMVLCCTTWGPADPATYLSLSYLGLENTPGVEYYVGYQLPLNFLFLLFASITFFFTSKIFDKKDKSVAYDLKLQGISPNDVEAPKFFCLLPLLPLIFVIVFSSLVYKTIVIGIISAVIISTILVLLIYAINSKKFGSAIELMGFFYDGMSMYMKSVAPIALFGTIFSYALRSIGGMDIVVNGLSSISAPVVIILILLFCLCAVVNAVLGNFWAGLSAFVPLATSLAANSGVNSLFLCNQLTIAAGCGACSSPVSSTGIYVACAAEITTVDFIKRNILPLLAGLVFSTIIGYYFI